jgi:hypothetical protein
LPLRCTELSRPESVVFVESSGSKNNELDKLLIIGGDRDSFKALVGRKIR